MEPDKELDLAGWQMPYGVAEHFVEQPPQGLVFAPWDWAAWLLLESPADFQVYMTANVQRVPRRVASDYGRIARAEPGWQRALDRYAVETLVIRKQGQAALSRAVGRSDKWTVAFEDDAALVARCVK